MTPSPEWTDALLADPHQQADKRSRVQKMFSAIAPKYDLNNRLHSFGRDQAWRRKAVKIATVGVNDIVVDVACGTGDLTNAFASKLDDLWRSSNLIVRGEQTPARRPVIGVDFTFEMLPLAKGKKFEWRTGYFIRPDGTPVVGDMSIWGTQYINGDAQALPLPDACCDVVSIAFGIRNVQSVPKALAEFHRVLRPGGRLVVLEFAKPRNRLIRFFNDLYTARIMPHTATWISGDKSGAYKYLPKSVETFIGRAEMSRLIAAAGFKDVTEHAMTFGICVCYRGAKLATNDPDFHR